MSATRQVLLTGASGFIGRHCIGPLLAAGYEVHAVTSRAPQVLGQVLGAAAQPPQALWHHADLLDAAQVLELMERVRPTHLLHFAWIVEPGVYWTSPHNLRWVGASLELLRCFRQCGGERAVVSGTCAEYDWAHGYCTEGVTPLAPATLYGTCKDALQKMTMSYAAQSGLSAAWGRIFLPYGPHEYPNRLVPSVIQSLLRGEEARASHGEQLRDFLFVQDVADAFVALLESEVPGPVNIASGDPVRLRHVVEEVGRQIGRPELVRLGAIASPRGDPPLLVGDVRRLRDEVGWQPSLGLEEGVACSIGWWREQ